MNLNNVILAVADRLSDAVATKILEKFDAELYHHAQNALWMDSTKQHGSVRTREQKIPTLHRRFHLRILWRLCHRRRLYQSLSRMSLEPTRRCQSRRPCGILSRHDGTGRVHDKTRRLYPYPSLHNVRHPKKEQNIKK